ncbi:hypothetical protein [uncultured Helicobacter sp.]|uniref:hypothetical protein n=1 Tax=uncultured Helicobacter sp. TaxID=175537 RepID=UPI0025990765|nr:hypothetical protein [uncultured Helicobacter sp.]
MNEILTRFPKTRKPLPSAYQAIYEEHYKSNRNGEGAASGLAQKLESWLHKKVADDTLGLSGHKTLEIGAGTLNQIPYERDLSHYDIIEPFSALYANSPHLKSVHTIYNDIAEIACNGGGDTIVNAQDDALLYDRIISCAALEHITDLPKVVAHACLLLKDDGIFSVSIPSQGRLLWTLAYKLTTGIEFRLKYKLNYDVIMNYEHVNTQQEIIEVCEHFFGSVKKSLFGLSNELSIYTHLSCRAPDRAKAREYLAQIAK